MRPVNRPYSRPAPLHPGTFRPGSRVIYYWQRKNEARRERKRSDAWPTSWHVRPLFGHSPPPPDLKKLSGTELLKAIRALKQVPEQEEEKGTLSFPNASFPRCIPTRSLWRDMLANDSIAYQVTELIIAGRFFVWANVYKATNVGDSDVHLWDEGLKMAKEYNLIKGFDPEEYHSTQAATGHSAFLIACKTQEAHARLLLHKTWTVRTKSKAATFFLAGDESWGSHVIYDIHGGGANFATDILPKLWRHCGSAIAQAKTEKKKTIAFRDLAFYRVPHNANTHKGATGIVWRVRFLPTPLACSNGWKAPHAIGFTNRGLVTMRRPPTCSHCISNSHGQNLCQWWTEGLMAGSKTRPDHYEEVKWTEVQSATWSKLGISDEAGPSLTL